jgi:hypothetical protein
MLPLGATEDRPAGVGPKVVHSKQHGDGSVAQADAAVDGMRFAYADPPYPGLDTTAEIVKIRGIG